MKVHGSIFFSFLALTLLTRCASEPEEADRGSSPQPSRLTSEQKRLAGIRTAEMEYRVISSVVSCTGEIEVPPKGMASVTAPLGGYIASTDIVPGKHVRKGELLARLRNPEYLVLQQSYLETAGQLTFARQDYARQKALVDQNAAAVKKLEESESSYRVLEARLAGLKGQLRMIGVSITELEKGNIQNEVSLTAPITGYVTEVNHHPGEFVDAREVIFHIVDVTDLHLHLNVFEKDIANIRRGQHVRFRPSGSDEETYSGEIALVSPQRNTETRTFDVHGHIDGEDERLKPGMYLQADIIVSSDSVYAIHRSALVRRGNDVFVLTDEQGDYRAVQVDTGASMDGWVEIKNHKSLLGKMIVTEGASRLFPALQVPGSGPQVPD